MKIVVSFSRAFKKRYSEKNMRLMVDQASVYALKGEEALDHGDMIAMGTPPGVGHARRPLVWMKAGDVVEIDNPIADED